MQIVGPAALGNKCCVIKEYAPGCFDYHSLTWLPVRAMLATDAELQAHPARNPLPMLHPGFPPPSLPAPPQRRAAQAWFLSLARLQSQIPSLCSGFPLGLTRGLSTKRRLLIICLKSPLHSAGKYDRPFMVNCAVCCHDGENVLRVCVWREVNLGEWRCFHY